MSWCYTEYFSNHTTHSVSTSYVLVTAGDVRGVLFFQPEVSSYFVASQYFNLNGSNLAWTTLECNNTTQIHKDYYMFYFLMLNPKKYSLQRFDLVEIFDTFTYLTYHICSYILTVET